MKFNVNWVILILFLAVITLFIVTDFSSSAQDTEEIGSFIIILLLMYFAFGYSPGGNKDKKTNKTRANNRAEKSQETLDYQDPLPKSKVKKERFRSDYEDSEES